jgi:hypothetical protein
MTREALLSPRKPEDQRDVLPDEEAIERARSLLMQVFQAEIDKALKSDNVRSKHELAEMLLKNEFKAADEPAEHFVLLHTARDFAAETGDFKLAQQAACKLIERYRVNDFDLRRRTVLEANKSLLPYFEQQSDDLRKECEQVLKLALQEDEFPAAKDLLKVLVETSRRRKPDRNSDQNAQRQRMQWLQTLEKQVDEMEKAYHEVLLALKVLEETAHDPTANFTLGAYLCLVKLRWTEGAPHLAMGSNLRLKILATEDNAPPVGAGRMADLANEYWMLSDQESGLFKRGLRLRAAHWYCQALPKLTSGLVKVQAERRLLDVAGTYGESLVKEALASMAEPNGADSARPSY